MTHLGLPKRVEAFDGILKAVFEWRCEHGDDSQGQAQATHATHRIGKLVRPLEAGVVVKLCVMRQPDRTPARREVVDHLARANAKLGPSIGLIAMHRGRGEHRKLRPFVQLQVLDQIEAIEFSLPCGHLRQMPAARRRGPTQAFVGIGSPVPLEDASNGGYRRHQAVSGLLQRLMNGGRSDE